MLPIAEAQLTSVWALPGYGPAQIIASGQGFPLGIAVGSDGSVYWANQHPFGSGQIVKLAPGTTSPTVLVSGLSYALGVGVDAAGNVYYDEYMQGSLYELPVGSSTPKILATGLNYPNFISVDTAGDVYMITGQTCGNTIVEYSAKTGIVSTIMTYPQLDGIFIHPSGDLYFAICSSNPLQIGLLTKGSSTPQIVYTGSQQNSQWYNWVAGVAVDATRNIFFTIYALSVQVLPQGANMPQVLATSSQDGYGHQLAVDLKDDIFFTDSYAGNIWKIPANTTPVPEFPSSSALIVVLVTFAIIAVLDVGYTKKRKRATICGS
jgi:hypothetical protein